MGEIKGYLKEATSPPMVPETWLRRVAIEYGGLTSGSWRPLGLLALGAQLSVVGSWGNLRAWRSGLAHPGHPGVAETLFMLGQSRW